MSHLIRAAVGAGMLVSMGAASAQDRAPAEQRLRARVETGAKRQADVDSRPTVTVSGFGPMVEAPVRMEIAVKMPQLERATLKELLDELDRSKAACDSAVRAAGSTTEIERRFGHDSLDADDEKSADGRVRTRWRGRGSMVVTGDDYEAMGRLAIALAELGCQLSFSFPWAPGWTVAQEARLEATANARSLAEDHARGMGLRLGRLISANQTCTFESSSPDWSDVDRLATLPDDARPSERARVVREVFQEQRRVAPCVFRGIPQVTLTYELLELDAGAPADPAPLQPTASDGKPRSHAVPHVWFVTPGASHSLQVDEVTGIPLYEPEWPMRRDLAEPVPDYPGYAFLPVGPGQGRP